MQYNFEAPCSKDQLRSIRNFVTEVLQQYSLSDLEINSMVLAVEEVCANLMIHSHQCNPKELIKVYINVEPGKGITFKIRDKGLGFDINGYKEPSIQDIIRKKKKGGLGLMLVKRIMDDIEFKREPSYNTYRLFKKCNSYKVN